MASVIARTPFRADDTGFRQALLLATILWFLIVVGVGRFLASSEMSPQVLAPVDAQIIQLPPDAPPRQPPSMPKAIPLPVPARHIVHHVARPRPRPKPTPAKEAMGARAIYDPMPQIPDNLREEAVKVVALARFTIAANGTATVVLIQPTPDPRINQIILNTLRRWRFFPALDHNQPVASVQVIRVSVEVD